MLRKKNYKEEDHFTQYYSAYLPRNNGSKLTFYYKRYRPANAQPNSVYNLLHQTPSTTPTVSTYPLDRTIQTISFDGSLHLIRPFFRKMGKIRKFIEGETEFRGHQAYYCIVIFKYEFDLVKCFREDYLQQIINRENEVGKAGEEEREAYQSELINTYMGEQLKQLGKLQQLQQEGYNVITNKLGQYAFDYDANQKSIEDLPQIRKKKKKEKKINRQHAEGQQQEQC